MILTLHRLSLIRATIGSTVSGKTFCGAIVTACDCMFFSVVCVQRVSDFALDLSQRDRRRCRARIAHAASFAKVRILTF
jgi:hypothetical protein